jgi:hypothetical protein
MAAILDFPSRMWGYDIVLGTIVTGDPKNIGFAIEILFLSLIHPDIPWGYFYSPPPITTYEC